METKDDDIKVIRHLMDQMLDIQSGIYDGYPYCCIFNFVRNLNCNCIVDKDSIYAKVDIEYRKRTGKTSGFIPCPNHCKKILKNEIKIEDLIQNRVCNKPFPDDKLCTCSGKYIGIIRNVMCEMLDKIDKIDN